jgi:hypothetical protein
MYINVAFSHECYFHPISLQHLYKMKSFSLIPLAISSMFIYSSFGQYCTQLEARQLDSSDEDNAPSFKCGSTRQKADPSLIELSQKLDTRTSAFGDFAESFTPVVISTVFHIITAEGETSEQKVPDSRV